MRLHQFNHFPKPVQAFLEKRLVFILEKPPHLESKETQPDAKGGIPIDTDPKTEQERKAEEEKKSAEAKKKAEEEAAKKRAEEEARKKAEAERIRQAGVEAKKQLSDAEQAIVQKHGGAVYEMSQMPGNKEKGYQNSVYINKPANPESFVDKTGKPVPPKIVYFFHGKDGGAVDAERVMRDVEERRKKGENIVLVMPNDTTGTWKDLDSKDAFKDMQRVAEQVIGAKNIADIAIISSKEGKAAVTKVMDRLRETAITDPEAKAIYDKLPTSITELGEENPWELHLPERALDALGGKAFMEQYKKCKTSSERAELIMEQLEKGNVPPHYRTFETVTVERKGHKMQFQVARHGFAFGTDDDYMEIPMDGPTAKAVADATGCSLPTKWHVDAIEAEAKKRGSYVRFFGQQDFAAELGLDPRVVHPEMTSPEFAEKRNEKARQWAREHGVRVDSLTYGDAKDVVLPEPGVTQPGQLEIYGAVDFTGKRVQELSGGVHEVGYSDYSHKVTLIADQVLIDGTPPPKSMQEVMRDPDMVKWFGYAARDISAAYPYDQNLKRHVDKIREQQSAEKQAPPVVMPPDNPATDIATTVPASPEPPPPPEYVPVAYRAPAQVVSSRPAPEPAQQPAPQPELEPEPDTAQQPISVTPQEGASEHNERRFTGKFYALGDSLTDGYVPQMRGLNISQILPEGKKAAVGMTTSEMLTVFRNKITNMEVMGATLIIMGGTNDIFMPDSLEKMKTNLGEIYKLGKQKGMNVIGATIPPVGDSAYAREWAKKTNTPFEKYNQELIERWKSLNEWIRSQNKLNDSSGMQIGPDEIMDFAALLEDPASPGRLRPEIRGQGGIHLNDYRPMANLIRRYIVENPALFWGHKPKSDEVLIEMYRGLYGSDYEKSAMPAENPQSGNTPADKPKLKEKKKPTDYQEWRAVKDWRTVAQLAISKQKEWIGKKQVGYTEIYADPTTGREYQLRVAAHQVKGATGYTIDASTFNGARSRGFPLSEAGSSYLYAVEIYEKNPDYEGPKANPDSAVV